MILPYKFHRENMRTLLVILLNALLSVHSQLHIRYSNDVFGRYVPFNSDGECFPHIHSEQSPRPPRRLEISTSEEVESEEDATGDERTPEFWRQDCLGGVAKQSYYFRFNNAAADRNVSYVSVSAGNLLGSGLWETATGFQAAAAAASLYDAMALGPEELRRGAHFLHSYLTSIHSARKQSVLACNLHSAILNDTVGSWSILEATCSGAGCDEKHTVGVVGFVDRASVLDTLGFLDPLLQLSNLSCVRDAVERLRADNATSAVVASGSISSLQRLRETGILDLPLDAVILSGLPPSNKTYLRQHNDTLAGSSVRVLTADTFGISIGDFELTAKASQQYSINISSKNDNYVYGVVNSLQQQVHTFFNSTVRVPHTLTSHDCDTAECSIGDILTDVMLVGAFAQHRLGFNRTDHPNPIAIWPASSIGNASIQSGDTTLRAIYNILPEPPAESSAQVALLTTDGATVISTFCQAVEGDFPADSRDTFLQVSGAHVTYDLDLAADRRAKYLMNLCFDCAPQQYLAVSPALNYTLLLPAFMLAKGAPWADLPQRSHHVSLTDWDARDALAAVLRHLHYLRSPVGGRIGFTHYVPDRADGGDSFIAVLVTIVVCMAIFGLALLGFRLWSNRQTHGGSMLQLLH